MNGYFKDKEVDSQLTRKQLIIKGLGTIKVGQFI